jgi:hypothetical protein
MHTKIKDTFSDGYNKEYWPSSDNQDLALDDKEAAHAIAMRKYTTIRYPPPPRPSTA